MTQTRNSKCLCHLAESFPKLLMSPEVFGQLSGVGLKGSGLRRSYLITPLNKYSCQYEHPSKNLSCAWIMRLFSFNFELICTNNEFSESCNCTRHESLRRMQFKLLEKLKVQMNSRLNEKNRRVHIDNIIMKNVRTKVPKDLSWSHFFSLEKSLQIFLTKFSSSF